MEEDKKSQPLVAPDKSTFDRAGFAATKTLSKSTESEESLKDVLLHFIFTTKLGFFGACAMLLLLIRFFVNPGIFGIQSFILALLIVYLSWEYYHRSVKFRVDGKKADLLWFNVILVPTCILGFFEVSFLWKQHAASELTREISGNPSAWAECQRFTPALVADSINAGFYEPSRDKDRAVIQYIYCKKWGDFYYSDKSSISDLETLWALGTIIHESIHVRGILNEAITQCLTNKAFPNVLRKYNLSEDTIRSYTEIYLRGTLKMPDKYQDGDCDTHPLVTEMPQFFGGEVGVD